MDQIIRMITRMVMRKLMRKGVGMAMDGAGKAVSAGGKAWRDRQERKAGAQGGEIDQDPAITNRRKLKDDEEKGDDVLYPTDEFTEDMQPRR